MISNTEIIREMFKTAASVWRGVSPPSPETVEVMPYAKAVGTDKTTPLPDISANSQIGFRL